MYLPDHFSEYRPDVLHAFLREHPLGMLITHGVQGLDADHLPFWFDERPGPHGALHAHVARANTVWQRCPTGSPVMVIFQGPQGYVSPNSYPSKHETHRQVPTWNYQVVHAHGTLTVHDDERYLRGLLARLTRQHEATEAQPWKMGDAPADYLEGMLRNIVGIEITLRSLVGKFKLSQNKDERDRLGATEAQAAKGRTALAEAMRRRG
jgi:transcriptional regulator